MLVINGLVFVVAFFSEKARSLTVKCNLKRRLVIKIGDSNTYKSMIKL